MEILALFFPASISVCIWHRRSARTSWSILPTLIEYGVWTTCNVLISVLLIVFVFHRSDITTASFQEFPFVGKYMIIAMTAAGILPYAVEIVSKCFGVTFVCKEREEEI